MRDFEQDRKICEAATDGPWRKGTGYSVVSDDEKGTHAFRDGEGGRKFYGGNLVCESILEDNAEFVIAAREGWTAALDEIQNLKLQLLSAGVFAASQPHCPDGKDCDGYSTSEQSCTACWLEYWRQKSGTFQNGNNHGTTSKTETVGEGAE